MHALNKDLRDRYPTARELGDALGCQPSLLGPASDRALKPTPASLVVLQGPRQGERFVLSDQALPLGRFELGSSNTMISRQHINISYRGGSYWLEDRSKNGTWVNNLRVYGEVPIVQGSVIVIGDNVLKLEHADARRPTGAGT
jgi:pSer/pThr/pTyr-binding forkhead associated (FHA) protein